MDNPRKHVKALVFGDSEKVLSATLRDVDRGFLGPGGTAIVAVFVVACRLFADRSVVEITQFVVRTREGCATEAPIFVRAGQALIRYALGEEAFEAALLTSLAPADCVRIAARLLVSMVREWGISEADLDDLLREASELSLGFTLSSAPVEMLRRGAWGVS
jgi:hypothetical protein